VKGKANNFAKIMAKLWQNQGKNEKKLSHVKPNFLSNLLFSHHFLLVRPAGFEPATYGFVVRRSVQAELRAQLNLIEI
jgi:hypothetical protein